MKTTIMKKTIIALAFMASLSEAAVFSGQANIYGSTAAVATPSFDLDGDGNNDVTLNVNYTVTMGADTEVAGTRWNVADDLSFSFDSVSVASVLNSDFTINSVEFDDYTRFYLWGNNGADSLWNTDTISLNGTDYTAFSKQHNLFSVSDLSISGTDTLDFSYVSGDQTYVELYSIRSGLSVDFTQVPEPSSTALLGLGGLALLARRKRV